MNKAFNNLVQIENISQYDEVIKILEKFSYDITDDNFHSLNSKLILLYEKGYSIDKILKNYSINDFILIDETIKKIIDDIFEDKNDNLIINNQIKFSDNQRTYLYETIANKINEENYPYNRISTIFKILIMFNGNHTLLLDILNLHLNGELICNDNILNCFNELMQITLEIVDDDFINLYINNLIEKCLTNFPISTLETIEKYKKQISIENIEKIESYTKIIINENTYKYVFNIYKEKSNTMLEKENTSLQLENFLINNIDLSPNLTKTLDLIKEKFNKINDIKIFIKKYLIIIFKDNIVLERKYREITTNYFANESSENQKLIILQLLSEEIYSEDILDKLVTLFTMNEFIDFNNIISDIMLKDFGKFNNNCKINFLNLLINLKKISGLIEYLTFVFSDLSDEGFICEILNRLENSKIKVYGQNNSKLWEVLNNASNSTSSGSLSTDINDCIASLRLRKSKKKTVVKDETLVS
ncbi:MAG: hypothetical protein PHD03_04660 [Bacilli bacterium]|nr:hypothetical protein [Bacilli bacterium]MDD4407364.1 hypothetical protein [Bacilli bacterium]